jgi:hypothetical protein
MMNGGKRKKLTSIEAVCFKDFDGNEEDDENFSNFYRFLKLLASVTGG